MTRKASILSNAYLEQLESLPSQRKPCNSIVIAVYDGHNSNVKKVGAYLANHLKEDLIGAYLHGSLATEEAIPYSDFDALVILGDSTFSSAERLASTAQKLSSIQRFMYQHDPLQHHGWFVLTELDLRYYCDAYFPLELFKYARSLFPDKGLQLDISSRRSADESREAFAQMAGRIIWAIEHQKSPKNMYQLKSLLSQFMLLPSLYLQVRNGQGVFKKYSFAAARDDFGSTDWHIMDKVSQIRLDWKYDISIFQKLVMTQPHYFVRYFAKKSSPRIPKHIASLLSVDFYSRMAQLVRQMQAKLNCVAGL